MHKAANSSQLIIMKTAINSMIVFNKNKRVDWKLAFIIDLSKDIMAFFGLVRHIINGHFDAKIAIPLTIVATIRGIIESKFAIKNIFKLKFNL